jgi:hypothetical protein
MARALDVHMRRLIDSAPRPGAKNPDAAVYVRTAGVPLSPKKGDLERLYGDARRLWASKF